MVQGSLKYWLALSSLKGIERVDLKGLLPAFGGKPGNIFDGKGALIDGCSKAFAKSVKEFDGWDLIDKEIDLADKHGARIITFDDPEYPRLLKEIDDPPCVLYAKGSLSADKVVPAVAVIGTRHPTHYGQRMAEVISRDLAGMGVAVVSGMARGCDMAAHRGALSVNGVTAAVLGTGIDIAYPRETKRLYGEIADKGVLLSEFPLSTPPLPQNFPRRNRIISGLSIGVVVIEAPLRSGSLMTARLALDYNRDVLAVPGQATSAKSMGTNRLIKDGATLVENAGDVMQALNLPYAKEEQKKDTVNLKLKGEEKLVWSALDGGPVHIDGIAKKTGLTAARTGALLLDMEIKGYVLQRPGKCFLRRF